MPIPFHFIGFYISRLLSAVFVLCFWSAHLSAQDFNPADTDYLWPTNASTYASSSFGETRSSHFHAALDIKTWGRKGYEVYATRDGILHRIGRSPVGYGNVVYLKHDDDSYSVYAHLETFIPQINQLVDSLRLAEYEFIFNENMESYNIRFEQGDVVGYSGASGVGPPHLHFELRTPTESPFNPLLTNLQIKDRRPPRFSSIAVEPIDLDATVEGQKAVFERGVWWEDGTYRFGTIDITGAVGLSVDAFDMADDVSNVYAAYKLEMKVDDQPYFSSRIDSFSYRQAKMMFLDRVYSILKTSDRGFQRLYRKDGNELPFYTTSAKKGIINLPPGQYEIEITASDHAGNANKLTGRLNIKQATRNIEHIRKVSFSSLLQQPVMGYDELYAVMTNWEWSNNWFRPEPESKDTSSVTLQPLMSPFWSDQYLSPPGTDNAISIKEGTQLISYQDRQFPMFRIYPEETGRYQHPTFPLSIRSYPSSVFDTLSVTFSGRYLNAPDADALAEFFLMPDHAPMKSFINATITLPDSISNPKTFAFYRYNERYNERDYIPVRVEGRNLTGPLGDFGTYQVIADTTKPKVHSPNLYQLSNGEWRLSVTATDDLSGINFADSRFFVNGVRGIVEYDPELDLIIYYHPDFVPSQTNTYRTVVVDAIGNRTELSGTFSK